MLKPISHQKLLHLLRDIQSINGNELTFCAPYDFKARLEKYYLGTWVLHAGNHCSTYWYAYGEQSKPVQSSINWLSFSLDQLLGYRISDITKAINIWKKQLIDNRNFMCLTTYQHKKSVNHTLRVNQQLYDIHEMVHRLENKLASDLFLESIPTEKIYKYHDRIKELWRHHWEIYDAHFDQVEDICHHSYEKPGRPIMLGGVLPPIPVSYKQKSSTLHRAQSNTYLLIQNTLIRHINTATQFRNWLQKIPSKARSFATSQNHEGFRWFSINLWLNAPLARERLDEKPFLTYAVACTWKAKTESDPNAFATLNRVLCKNHKQLLSSLGLPATWAMMRMIIQHEHLHRQRALQPRGGFISVTPCYLELLKTQLDKLIPRKPKMWLLLAPHQIEEAWKGALFLNKFINLTEHLGAQNISVRALFKAFILNTPYKAHIYRSVRFYILGVLMHLSNNHEKPCQRTQALSDLQQLCSNTSPRQIIRLHEHVCRLRDLEKRFPVVSPIKSLPDNWKALTTISSIRQEAQEMNHCLYERYLEAIAEGTMFAYAIITLSKKRATVTITKSPIEWNLDQIVYEDHSDITHIDYVEVRLALIDKLDLKPRADKPAAQFDKDPMIQSALSIFETKLAT